jgi:hypothetical protein
MLDRIVFPKMLLMTSEWIEFLMARTADQLVHSLKQDMQMLYCLFSVNSAAQANLQVTIHATKHIPQSAATAQST